MNKIELIQEINNNPRNVEKVTRKQTQTVLESLEQVVKKHLVKEGEFFLPGFGTFKMITRPARVARNPQSGEPVNVPEKRVVKFKILKSFKSDVES